MKRTPLKRGNKPLKRSPLKSKGRLRPRSQKRERQYAEYRPRREAFLQEHPRCQAPNCTNPSVDIHHIAKRNGARLTDETKWLAVCRGCHDLIERDREWAYQNGFLERVNGVSEELA